MQNSTARLIASFKALADPVRLRITALCARGECSVSELTQVMGESQPRVSQHLRQLCEAGLLERFRDGQYVYYRVPLRGARAAQHRRLMELFPDDERQFERDRKRLQALRGEVRHETPAALDDDARRRLHRALVELTVTAPLGDLIDIGSGRGGLLKLLASRARRVIGVDLDADARQFARAELMLAGIDNCSLRKGDMYDLPFGEAEFDTVVLDDVLGKAERPMDALREACRLLRSGGRLIILSAIGGAEAGRLEAQFADWCRHAGVRMAAPRLIPRRDPCWLLAIATQAESRPAAA
jgi:DNA-binding transcriptional ArsR family regulator/precorrin-6B methylase 2